MDQFLANSFCNHIGALRIATVRTFSLSSSILLARYITIVLAQHLCIVKVLSDGDTGGQLLKNYRHHNLGFVNHIIRSLFIIYY